ncbi:MAG TPA: methionyl-tRNA formyltransferase [Candidatus Acidoferrales bacterium]|nr:methionyl-tRNA formyltransferase [Candidatus Acidoferrales bacterium]
MEPTVPATSGVPTVFLGTGPFALPILDALASVRDVRVVGVVTGPPRPVGRGARVRRSPVALRAEALGIGPILELMRVRAESAVAGVLALGPELLVLADYGQIVPGTLLARPRYGALNLHPSLLPRHRGASPVAATILAGDRQAGVTLMRMDEGLDTGPVVAQVAVPLHGAETATGLEAWLAAEAAELLRSTIGDWLAGRRPARPQPTEGVTVSRPLRREQGRLDPEQDAVTLERQVRAYQPWPGTWCLTVAGRLIVWAARSLVVDRPSPPAVHPSSGDGEVGRIVPDGDGLAVLVADGGLRLDEVQLAGGRRMSAAALRRGHPELVGSRVGDPELP